MKKYLFGLIVLLTAAFALVSCSDDDKNDPYKSFDPKYQFYEPCIQWTCSKAEVRNYMSKLNGWEEDVSSETAKNLTFVNKSISASMTYYFGNDGLDESSLTYYENKDFEKFKSDLTSRYNLTWKTKTYAGYEYLTAPNEDLLFEATLQKGTSVSGDFQVDYMNVVFTYTTLFF